MLPNLAGLKVGDLAELLPKMTGFGALSEAIRSGHTFDNLVRPSVLDGVDLAALRLSDIDASSLTGMTSVLRSIKGVADITEQALTSPSVNLAPFLLPDMKMPRLPDIQMPELPYYEPELAYITSAVPADVVVLRSVESLLVDVRDELVAGRELQAQQTNVIESQTTLLESQGLALIALVNDAKGQKWNRRITLFFVGLGAAVGFVVALYTIGFLRPMGQ